MKVVVWCRSEPRNPDELGETWTTANHGLRRSGSGSLIFKNSWSVRASSWNMIATLISTFGMDVGSTPPVHYTSVETSPSIALRLAAIYTCCTLISDHVSCVLHFVSQDLRIWSSSGSLASNIDNTYACVMGYREQTQNSSRKIFGARPLCCCCIVIAPAYQPERWGIRA